MQAADYDEATLHAFMAQKEGKGSAGQQKAVLEHILWKLCKINQLSFSDGDERKTAFNEGARWVGLQIAGMLDPGAVNFTTEAKAKKRTTTRRTKPEAKND